MRGILFRGKTKSSNKWLYGYVRCFESEDKYFIEESIEGYVYEVVKDTIGQFTGLLDKNKNEIFEGDILKAKHSNFPYLVSYKECAFKIEDKYGNLIKKTQDAINWLEIEIIGNIHNNPELLSEV